MPSPEGSLPRGKRAKKQTSIRENIEFKAIWSSEKSVDVKKVEFAITLDFEGAKVCFFLLNQRLFHGV